MLRTIKLLLIILIVPLSCKDHETTDQNSINGLEEPTDAMVLVTNEQFRAANMETDKILEMNFPEHINSTGFIDVPPSNKAVINAFIGGYIKSTNLLAGDVVKKGQLLVTIENPEFIQIQQQFMEAEEQLSYLQNEFQRQKALYEERITSEKNYLKAESEYKRTFALRNALDKKLQMLNINPARVKEGIIATTSNIYAPIDGSITKIFVSKGSYVSPADKIMEIVNLDHIHLELDVFEKDVLRIRKSQKIEFTLPESSDETFKGLVHLIGSEIDESKRTIKVHGHFKGTEDESFAIGMFVEAVIIAANKPVKALPETAVVEIEDTSFVLKLVKEEENNYTFEKIEVEISGRYNGFVSLTENQNLNASDQILIKGAYGLIKE